MKPATFIVILLLTALGGMWALAGYESAHARALEAQALVTANQTTQISVVGQTILGLILGAILALLIGGVIGGLLLFKRWQQLASSQPSHWTPGPNARWQKTGQIDKSALPEMEPSPQALLLQQQMMQQQLLTLWLMKQMNVPAEPASMPTPQLPEPENPPLPWWDEP